AVPDEAVTEDVKETEEEQQADTADTGDLAEEKEDEEERVDDLWANAFNEQAEYENVKVKPSTGELDQINAEIEALERRKQQDSEMYDTSLQEIEEEHEVYTGDEELLMPDNEGEDEGGDDIWAAALDKQTFDEESGEKKTSDSIRQSLDETVINEHDSDMSADKLWSETLKDQLESSTETSPVNDKSGGTPGAAG
ncbi:MAG: hypothetical protein JSW20_14935, partial [Nitrospiraceae bacterium]